MRFVLIYATTEGQTRRIVRFCADRLAAAGHSTETIAAGDAGDLDPGRADAAILAASLHAEQYQRELRAYARGHADALNRMPTLFLAVSLAAAGKDEDEWRGLDRCTAALAAETGWTPGRVVHVAGAFRFAAYDFFKGLAMRWIARQHGLTIPPDGNLELTDWAALGAALDAWVATLPSGAA